MLAVVTSQVARVGQLLRKVSVVNLLRTVSSQILNSIADKLELTASK